mmetsp:Transcript_8347/g.14181  ORF Transcript_8347/g.14181 Transcript_8347/m.14181 type:complete len:116 (+) Transcript_8347:1299-1646(+)
MSVSSCSLHLEHTVFNRHRCNIKCSSTQVINKDVSFRSKLIIHSVGNCSSGRLIDYAVYIQTRNCTGILCSPTLIIIEVGRNGNNRILHFFSQIGLGSRLHLLKDHGRNFFRSEL